MINFYLKKTLIEVYLLTKLQKIQGFKNIYKNKTKRNFTIFEQFVQYSIIIDLLNTSTAVLEFYI